MRCFLQVLYLTGLISCVEEIKPDFGNVPVHYVLNAILNPDSVIRLTISRSMRADQTGKFPAVTDAVVEISGGGAFIRLPMKGNGEYLLEDFPEVGKTYQLKATCSDGTILSASAKVPGVPGVWISPLVEDQYLQVTLQDVPSEENFYWVGLRSYHARDRRYDFQSYVESNFLHFDDFNRGRTIDRFGRNTCEYHFYARLPDVSFRGKQAVFKIPWFWPPEDEDVRSDWKHYIYIISADRHLDRYMKTAVIQYELGVIGDMPVFYTPIDIYGNIASGKGIFGSCTLSQFEVTNP